MNPFPLPLTEITVATVCVIAGIMQTNCTIQAVWPETENFMMYAYIYTVYV